MTEPPPIPSFSWSNAPSSPLPRGLVDALAGADPWLVLLAGVCAAFLCAALGFALGWFVARAGHRRARESFAALAADALRDNTEGFLALAGERFARLEEASESDWETRRRSLDDTVGPLREALDRYRSETIAVDRARANEAGALAKQLQTLASETTRLAGALRGPAPRGRWGELTLRRTAELAGLSEHCDFSEQVTMGKPGNLQRPDMLVRLPGGREVAVDAKAPLDAYLGAAEAIDDDARRAALVDHARQVRRHVDALSKRDYAASLERAPEFVVLFLPDESFLGAAVSHDRTLVEHSLAKGVVLATPATLYALLGAVARGWREARMAEGSREVLVHARELDDRLGLFVEHLTKLGGSLGRSVESFNRAVGSLESRVLPKSRQMRELGVEGRREMTAPDLVSVAVRPPVPPIEG
jgi:DNA recombination protein RmuC